MKCQNCNIEHEGTYGSGRFCSNKCARSFSTKSKRLQINEKVSKKLIGREKTEGEIKSLKEAWIKRRLEGKTNEKRLCDEDFFVLGSKNNNQKIKERLFESKIKDYCCEICKISEYNGNHITLQLHHINGNNKDNRIENLQILCPNCHSQTENYAGKNLGWGQKKY